MGIEQSKLDDAAMTGGYTQVEVMSLYQVEPVEPPLSYAQRQKMDTFRQRDEQSEDLSTVKWTSLTEVELAKIMRTGECQGQNMTNMFYPETESNFNDKQKIVLARRACGNCALEGACLEYALDTRQKFGFWGGKTEKERRRIIKSSQRSEQRARLKAELETLA